MSDVALFIFVTTLGVICGIFASKVAEEKGFSGGAWFVAGIVFSLIALLAAVGLPDRRARQSQQPPAQKQ
jgi:hypothetical protein